MHLQPCIDRAVNLGRSVKQALRGVDRDPTSEADLREVFFLFDLDGDYQVTYEETTEIIKLLSKNGEELMCILS